MRKRCCIGKDDVPPRAREGIQPSDSSTAFPREVSPPWRCVQRGLIQDRLKKRATNFSAESGFLKKGILVGEVIKTVPAPHNEKIEVGNQKENSLKITFESDFRGGITSNHQENRKRVEYRRKK